MALGLGTHNGGRQFEPGEPPHRYIAEELHLGTVVPFLGAGASLFHETNGVVCPPTGSALAEMLAKQAEFPHSPEYRRKELPRVASYFEHVQIGRRGLRRVLRKVFEHPFQPNDLHKLLAEISKRVPILIITTNYDDIVEKAFSDAGVGIIS